MRSSLAGVARAFQREGLPLSIPLRASLDESAGSLQGPGDPVSSAAFFEPRLRVLIDAPLESRQAIAAWAEAEAKVAEHQSLPFAASHAVEVGAWILPSVVQPPSEEDEDAEEEAQRRAKQEAARQLLDELALEVKQAAPDLFPDPETDPQWLKDSHGQAEPSKVKGQLRALAQVIRHSHGFRPKPFEWLWEGLQPVLLPDVMARKWGIPLSLAVLYTCVGLRLGMCLMPQKIRHTPAGDEKAAQALRDAQQGHGLATSLPPSPDAWLLHPTEASAAKGGQDAAFLDPASGRIITAEECRRFHPHHGAEVDGPLHVWIESLRITVMAHQRSGNGDAVAHCLYQLLALDMHASEWGSMLAERP